MIRTSTTCPHSYRISMRIKTTVPWWFIIVATDRYMDVRGVYTYGTCLPRRKDGVCRLSELTVVDCRFESAPIRERSHGYTSERDMSCFVRIFHSRRPMWSRIKLLSCNKWQASGNVLALGFRERHLADVFESESSTIDRYSIQTLSA
jgi:hypothetical protein